MKVVGGVIKHPLRNRRFAWRRAVALLVAVSALLAGVFLYNLWRLYQPAGLCEVSPRCSISPPWSLTC